MRVLAIYGQPHFWSMGEGAGAVVFSRTLETLARQGHEVHVSLPTEPDKNAPASETYRGFTLHREVPSGRFIPRARLPMLHRVWERTRSWQRYQSWGTKAGLEVARRFEPDLVVGYGAFEGPVAARIARKIGRPNITRLFGTWLNLDSRIKYYLNLPELSAFRTPANLWIMTNDGSNGDRAAITAGVPKEKLVFVRNGLDFERFRPGAVVPAVREQLGMTPDQPLILAVSRLSYEKKLERAIDAVPMLRQRIPGAVLALLGDGPDRAGLEERARQLGVADSVRFPGAVAYTDLPQFYQSADAFLSLLDRTNAANPTFEAMACGCLVIALDSGTTTELVHHDDNGWILTLSQLPELGGIIADRLEDEPRSARLREKAARSIREVLPSPEQRLLFEIDLYERIARREPIPRELTCAADAPIKWSDRPDARRQGASAESEAAPR